MENNMRHYLAPLFFTAFAAVFSGCENRDLNEGEQFQPREIHQNIAWTFDNINVDGVDYLILQKDNNNPHEGFGFMAVRGNIIIQKQDSILAYLKAQKEVQKQILAILQKKSPDQVGQEIDNIYESAVNEYNPVLKTLTGKTYGSKPR